MICNKCKVDYPIEKFDTYFHSSKNKHYTRKICNPCMRIGYREYKLKVKSQQIPVPVIPDDWKQCCDCMVYQPLDNYYLNKNKNHIKRCKECHGKMYREYKNQKLIDTGGADSYYKEPNRYWDEEQKKNVFMVMEAFGWIFDEPTGIWNKPGIKENGVFINIISTDKPKRKRPSVPHGRKIKSGVHNNIDKIVKLIEEGYTYNDVADTFDCSHTTIRSVVTNYRNGKKP
jgi:hypothetical protein